MFGLSKDQMYMITIFIAIMLVSGYIMISYMKSSIGHELKKFKRKIQKECCNGGTSSLGIGSLSKGSQKKEYTQDDNDVEEMHEMTEDSYISP